MSCTGTTFQPSRSNAPGVRHRLRTLGRMVRSLIDENQRRVVGLSMLSLLGSASARTADRMRRNNRHWVDPHSS